LTPTAAIIPIDAASTPPIRVERRHIDDFMLVPIKFMDVPFTGWTTQLDVANQASWM
jgi:hypothetical protein